MSSIPPRTAVGQDYNRKNKPQYGIKPPRSPFGIVPGGGTGPGTTMGEFGSKVEKMAEASEADWEKRKVGPATTGKAKQAENEAVRDAAHGAAETLAPGGQPDTPPVTKPTSSGASGPALPTQMDIAPPWAEGIPLTEEGEPDVDRFGEQGSVTVHSKPGGDPALKPGGFAHRGGTSAPPPRSEYGTVARGPEGATGGHNWTLRTPGRREAEYEEARYEREVQGRQKSEDAAIAALDAQAAESTAMMARSKALTESPFEVERAEIAAAVGKEAAKAQPEMQAQGLAGELYGSYRDAADAIRNDPNMDETERAARLQEIKEEFWMALIALRPKATKPREEYGMGMLPPDEA